MHLKSPPICPSPLTEKIFRDEIFHGEWRNFHRPRALFLAGVKFHVLPRILACFLVEFDLPFAFGVLSCRILDSTSLFSLHVHEHGTLGFGMLTMETAVFKSLSTRGPGRRDTCHLTDLSQTFTDD